MSETIRKAVAAVADVVLAYRPKSKQPKPRKRKKASTKYGRPRNT